MENYDGFLKNSKKMHGTKILPLRWIGNLCEKYANYHLGNFLHYSDHDDYGLACRYHAYMSTLLYKPYRWWGTYYTVDLNAWKIDSKTQELLGRLGSDYDENVIPYWENEGGPVDSTEERLKYMEDNGI